MFQLTGVALATIASVTPTPNATTYRGRIDVDAKPVSMATAELATVSSNSTAKKKQRDS